MVEGGSIMASHRRRMRLIADVGWPTTPNSLCYEQMIFYHLIDVYGDEPPNGVIIQALLDI